jgi:hypothetical protein
MFVENSNVMLASQSGFKFEHSSETTIQLHYGQSNNENSTTEFKEAFSLNVEQSYVSSTSQRMVYDYEENMSLEDRIKKMIIEKLFERLYGEEHSIEMYPAAQHPKSLFQEEIPVPKNPYSNSVQEPKELKAMVFQTQEHYYQKQSVDFVASVKIQTPHKTFEMSLELSFSQELYASRSSQMIIGDESFIDPLVINFDENINPFDNISSLKFAFDLDNDGMTEMIPTLKQGAGFLAWDKNSNGKIDNGHELFGPKTNNGFEELSIYDKNKDNWIDENDTLFDKLQIFSFDENGNASLTSLLDKNVGAIYLGEVQSGFKYQNTPFQTDAVQKSNGIFIKQDGSKLGVVNSIDVVV